MIRRQVVVPAAPADVWEFITAPDTPDSWLGGHLEWTAEEGGSLRFEGHDGKVRRGVVETVRPLRYIRYRWWPEDDSGEPESEVAFLLEPGTDSDGEGTRLTVSERVATAPGPGPAESVGAGPAASASSVSASASEAGPAASTSAASVSASVLASASGVTSATWTAGDDRRFRAWAGAHALLVRP